MENGMERAIITSMESFAACHETGKDGCFIRMLGRNAQFERQLLWMDDTLTGRMREGELFYQRVTALPALSAPEDIRYYTQCYDRWRAARQQGIRTKVSSGALAVRLGAACEETLKKYCSGKAGVTESICRNFTVKLLYRFDFVLAGCKRWNTDTRIKIVADNVVNEQEYFFYYLLAQTGCDVMLLQSGGDLTQNVLKNLSQEVRLGAFQSLPVAPLKQQAEKIVVKIPQRNRSGPASAGQPSPMKRQEKSFEQLAALASSIVLILVHDENGDVMSTGSGIMIGTDGYILTNDHVVRGGASYAVRIENDDTVYETDELIKYHTTLDLALLRIARRLQPIPIYEGPKKLVRGQAVAAIGSPLGLFNSISDGIISGFRTIDGVDMIQFTAPISHGSSGGAVLNMYGEVIGISTAGFDRGQNINLAVGYESINLFIQGFRS